MNRERFAKFLEELREADEKGLDLDAIVKAHEHENAYIYNDCVFKKIFASEKNIVLTTDLVNAALGLTGPDRIKHPKLVNPFIPGELGYRNTEPDLSLVNDRGDGNLATASPSRFSTRLMASTRTDCCSTCRVSLVEW